MQPVLNIEDVKCVEVALTREGVSVSELMHRAGCAAAQEVLELGDVDNVVVLVGLGNNGGDGWVAAEALHAHGANVTVVTPVDPDELAGDLARQVAQSAVRAGIQPMVGPARDELENLLATSDVVLDCMLGTGFHGEVRAPFDIWIDCVNACAAQVVSVDVPSGLSAQTGHVSNSCVVADMTVTMLALKPRRADRAPRGGRRSRCVAHRPRRLSGRRLHPHDGGRQVLPRLGARGGRLEEVPWRRDHGCARRSSHGRRVRDARRPGLGCVCRPVPPARDSRGAAARG